MTDASDDGAASRRVGDERTWTRRRGGGRLGPAVEVLAEPTPGGVLVVQGREVPEAATDQPDEQAAGVDRPDHPRVLGDRQELEPVGLAVDDEPAGRRPGRRAGASGRRPSGPRAGRRRGSGLGASPCPLPRGLEINPSRPAPGGVLVFSLLPKGILVNTGGGNRGPIGGRGGVAIGDLPGRPGPRPGRSGRRVPSGSRRLVGGLGRDPSQLDQLGPGGLDPPEVDAEDAGDPGGLDPPPAVESACASARGIGAAMARAVAISAGRAPPARSRRILRGMATEPRPPPMVSARAGSSAGESGKAMAESDQPRKPAATSRPDRGPGPLPSRRPGAWPSSSTVKVGMRPSSAGIAGRPSRGRRARRGSRRSPAASTGRPASRPSAPRPGPARIRPRSTTPGPSPSPWDTDWNYGPSPSPPDREVNSGGATGPCPPEAGSKPRSVRTPIAANHGRLLTGVWGSLEWGYCYTPPLQATLSSGR